MADINTDQDESDMPEALFLRPEKHERTYSLADAIRVSSTYGDDTVLAYNRLRQAVRSGYVHSAPVTKGARTALHICDIAAFKVLSAFYDAGVADAKASEAVSIALYSWQASRNPKPVHLEEVEGTFHPISAALLGIAQGEEWVLRFDLHRLETGEICRVVTVFDVRFPPPPPKDVHPALRELPPYLTTEVRLLRLLSPMLFQHLTTL